jgi:hypothetical protein
MVSVRIVLAIFLLGGAPAAMAQSVRNLYESLTPPSATSQLDRIVFERLAKMGIRPALCSDAVFVRRIYLDLIGTLPTAQEARAFLQDPDVLHKCTILIDRLLAREEFADYWAMRWGDVLRIKAEFPVNLWPNAAQAYHHWVRESIAENKPYDRFAWELLTSSGSNFRVGPVNFYRAIQNRSAEGIAGAVALTFMGSRVDSWPEDRLKNMAVFFSQVGYKPTREWKEECVFWDPLGISHPAGNVAPEKPAPGAKAKQLAESIAPQPPGPRAAIFPDGTTVTLSSDQDPREVFACWLVSPTNRWFTRAIVNRVWYWLMGRGIIHEPDDIRDDNPPSDPRLLAYLEKEMTAGHYDLKRLCRLIVGSSTYQLSCLARVNSEAARANFASYPLRRLEAEVLIDAINKITGTSDLYTSPIPEPFTYIPREKPAIAIADGSITSPFLTLFGRSARATGIENERSNRPIPAQWLHLLNSSHIQRKLEQGPGLRAIFTSGRKSGEIVDELYLTILSRLPSPQEKKTVAEYVRSRPRRDAATDIPWALINNPEFLYRH